MNILGTMHTPRLPSVRLAVLCAAMCILAGLDAHTAYAHGYLVRSIPQDRSSVAHSPSRVQIWFSEGLEPKYSTLIVTDRNGNRVDLGDGGVSPTNRAQLSVRLPPNLPDGAYIATMRVAFSSDGHIQTDTLVFWVGDRGPDVATSNSTQDVYPVEIAARGLLNLGLLFMFGTLIVYRVVLYPAWSNPAYPAGGLAPRIMKRVERISLLAIVVAVCGNLVWLFEQASVLFTADIGRVFRDTLWLATLNTTQFGDIWKLRLVLILAVALLILAARQLATSRPKLVFSLYAVALLVAGAACGTMSLASHAPGATLWPGGAILADWLHYLAASAWVGGLGALVLVIGPALGPLDGEGRRLALLAALRRFSPMAVGTVGLMAATGAYAALTYVVRLDQIPDTAYGRTLFAKMVLVVPLLLLGLAHHLALRPGRFHAASAWIGRTLRAETACGAVVILAAAFLTATPPPIPPDARAKADLPQFTAQDRDLALTLTPNPGAVGTNSYDVRLTKAGLPLDGATITMQFIFPELGKRSALMPVDPIGDGLYGAAGAELNRPGYWQAAFDVIPPGDTVRRRIALAWVVPEQASVGADRQPTILNWVSALTIIAVAALWAGPTIRRRVRSLGFDRQTLTIGAGAALLTILVLGAGTAIIAASARAFEDAATPRPQYVNTVLPDAASIRAGSALGAICDVFRNARTRPADYLQARTDSALFAELRDRSDSGCARLNDADRWNLINAVRYLYPPPR